MKNLRAAEKQTNEKVVLHVLKIETKQRTQLRDITAEINKLIREAGIETGLCHLYLPHTTAAITINENDDPDVPRDIEAFLDRLVPRDGPYKHWEGNADSHIKSTLIGVSETVFIERGRLSLGRWQAVFFCEFDGPRQREVRVKLVRD